MSAVTFEMANGVARITLNRPDRLNALNLQMHAELSDALTAIEASSDVRVVVLRGEGRGFCAGQDLGERGAGEGGPRDLGGSVETFYNPLVRRLATLKAPTVAAVNGVAAGAGANLALACDFVIAAHDARFIQAFIGIGLMPDAGGTWRLPRLVGPARATGLAMLGEPLDAPTAEAWGLIWRAAPEGRFDEEVEALVARLAAAPTRALIKIREALRSAWSMTLDQHLDLERDGQRELGFSNDYQEGVAAFKAKRPPRFRGR